MFRIFCGIGLLSSWLKLARTEKGTDIEFPKKNVPSRQLRIASQRSQNSRFNAFAEIENNTLPLLTDAGEPLSQNQWDTMNNRDLFFMEMALRMGEPNGQWGDNQNGIANPAAYQYKPGGVQDYVNSYVAEIESMALLAHDKYVFPAEAGNPYPAPRWSVVRISRKDGKGGDVLAIAFRGSSGDESAPTSIDWNTFDADLDPSQVTQTDGMRFTKGFFDESLCIMMANGLYDVLSSDAVAGVSEVITTGHSLGGAWASILMTRIDPNQVMQCLDNAVFKLDFGLLARAVTFGKPAPFYASQDPRYDLVDRETDYVYHADLVARASSNSAATIGCKRVFGNICWAGLENLNIPYFKPGQTHNLENLFHGDTNTIWILNKLNAPFVPQVGKFPKAQRGNIMAYNTDTARSQGINVQFLLVALRNGNVQAVMAAAGDEHGEAYLTVPWDVQQQSHAHR